MDLFEIIFLLICPEQLFRLHLFFARSYTLNSDWKFPLLPVMPLKSLIEEPPNRIALFKIIFEYLTILLFSFKLIR